MGILNILNDTIFWKKEYKNKLNLTLFYDYSYSNSNHDDVPEEIIMLAKRIACYYELNGKSLRLSPEDGALTALTEFSNEYRALRIDEETENKLALDLYYFNFKYKSPLSWENATDRAIKRQTLISNMRSEANAAVGPWPVADCSRWVLPGVSATIAIRLR